MNGLTSWGWLELGMFLLVGGVVGYMIQVGEAPEKVKALEQNVTSLQTQIENLKQNFSELEKENEQLQLQIEEYQAQYDKLKEETSILLLKYLAQEAFWDAIGSKELHLICGIARITLRDSIPEIKKLPC